MNEGHFKDLLFELIPPPAQRATTSTTPRVSAAGAPANPAADLMMMGFPTRLPDASLPSFCVCHSELRSQGFLCPRCLSKMCDVPTDCDVCGLMVVSSPHLARSYHHLFPVKPYVAMLVILLFLFMDLPLMVFSGRMNETDIPLDAGNVCHACARLFPEKLLNAKDGMSPFGRYRCQECHHDFCSECDVFVHDVVHCCPGCGK